MLHVVDGAAQERAKYAEIWGFEEYHKYSPGLVNVDRFMAVCKPPSGSSLIDIGCGSGKAGIEFQNKGMAVHWLDITDAGLDHSVNRTRFIEEPLWSENWACARPMGWDYGFCCDVLEHIPTEYTMLVLDRILSSCRTAWLQIALRPDEFGKMIGEPLHLTVRPYSWWLIRLATLGKVIDARDLCGNGLFVVECS
jgi:hypothetical protein